MHIFCRETRAHLELHPHLHGNESSGTLITPDLWLRNCKSPETSSLSPPASPTKGHDQPQTAPLPLITVAHSSKLLNKPPENTDCKRNRIKVQKKQRKRTTSGSNVIFKANNDTPQDLRVRHSPVEVNETRTSGGGEKERFNKLNTTNPIYSDTRPKSGNSQQLTGSQMGPSEKGLFDGLLPPPTVLVPYPIIIPIPIPLPIPIPIPNILMKKMKEESSQTDEINCVHLNTEQSSRENGVEEQGAAAESQAEDNIRAAVNCRPLRKRKKVSDFKSKLIVKNKHTTND